MSGTSTIDARELMREETASDNRQSASREPTRPPRRLRYAPILALAATLVVPGGAPAQAIPNRILVLPLAVKAGPAGATAAAPARENFWLGEATALLLTERLDRLGAGVLSRDERVAGFDRLQLAMSPTLTRATMIRVGEFLGATHLVFGTIEVGDTLSLTARVVRLSDGLELPAVTDRGAAADVFALCTRVGDRVGKTVGGSLLDPPRKSDAPPSLEVFQNYIKGLMAP